MDLSWRLDGPRSAAYCLTRRPNRLRRIVATSGLKGRIMRKLVFTCAAVLVVTLAACGGGDNGTPPTQPTPDPAAVIAAVGDGFLVIHPSAIGANYAMEVPVRITETGGGTADWTSARITFLAVDGQEIARRELTADDIAAAGLTPAQPRSVLYPSPEDIARVVRWRTEQGLAAGSFALMHAGSSSDWPSKRWPAEYFLALARRLEASGRRCVWIGGDADREINRLLTQTVGVDATGRFSILQLYELGRAAAFAVTNDSGPMHILAASGLRVYAFFGPTNWIRSHAVGQSQRILTYPVDCSPCFLGRCPPAKGHACLRKIEPADVYRKIKTEGIFF